MPHQTLKLIAGVDQNETPALNEAGISSSNLIRFVPDRNGVGLIQKLGGWTKYISTKFTSKIVSLLAWEDLNVNNWLGVATTAGVSAVLSGSVSDVSARILTSNNTANLSTTSGSNLITVVDSGSSQSIFNYVRFVAPVAVTGSGLVLNGVYPINTVLDTNTYTILASSNATATVTGVGTLPQFTTTSGQFIVKVTLANHGQLQNSTFAIPISASGGGVTLYGTYNVFSVIDANNFNIIATSLATSSVSFYENSNLLSLNYYIGISPVPQGSGWGVGGYGTGGWGTGSTPTATTGTPIAANDWSLDNFGQLLVACPVGGAIYYWSPSGSIQNLQLTSVAAPLVNDGLFVAMPQRQIVAWGSTVTGVTDPLLIRWCDIQDFTTWTAASTNQAGSYRIPRGSRIVAGVQGSQQGLIWTDIALWSMQYINQPFVYGFNEIGTGCGLISRKAYGIANNETFWMSQSQFFELSGSGVAPLFCPVWDVIFQQLDKSNVNSIRCAVNSQFNEVTWFYPTVGSGGLNTNYVKYNYFLKQWDFGVLGRTAWINQSILGPPIGAGTDNYLYQHETSNDADTLAMNSSFQTGYFAISDADIKVFIDQVWPDMKFGTYNGVQSANVSITFYATDYAGTAPKVYGPFNFTQATTFITPRLRGRLISIGISSSDFGSFWRTGAIRYRYAPDGKY